MIDATEEPASNAPLGKLKPLPAGLKQFRTPGQSKVLSGTGPGMPRPLLVMILDETFEREGRSAAVLTASFEYTDPRTKRCIRVPRTFVTDFASVPWLARGLVESFGRHSRAAVIHDWLYAVNEGTHGEADDIALQAMKDLNVSGWKLFLIGAALRIGGGGAWKKMNKEWSQTWANAITGKRKSADHEQSAFYRNVPWPNDPELG